MKLALPPSSKPIFFTVSALCRMRMRPTSVEPVKVTFFTMGDAHKTLPTSGAFDASQVMMLNTPLGMPACSASAMSASAQYGVCSAGFTTNVQPTARPGAHLRVIIAIGKFHGVIAAQTPIGCLITTNRRSGDCVGITSPYARFPSSANHSTKLAPYATSPFASANGLPCSSTMRLARSSALAMMRSNHLRKIAARAFALILLHAGSAALAASIARWVSAAPMSGT